VSTRWQTARTCPGCGARRLNAAAPWGWMPRCPDCGTRTPEEWTDGADPGPQEPAGGLLGWIRGERAGVVVTEAPGGAEPVAEVERHGALVIEVRGPWTDGERPGLAEVRAVTDWGPWAQHNFPCPVCKQRAALVDLDGWVFQPCHPCQQLGWELRAPARGKLRRWLRGQPAVDTAPGLIVGVAE
jgi:hypothetical protein